MTITIVSGISVFLQLAAAVQAIRLVRLTGARTAWSLIATGMFLMTMRRVLALVAGVRLLETSYPDPATEYVGLLISLLLLVGMTGIAPIFTSIKKTERALNEAGQRLAAIIQTSPQAIVAMDTAENVQLWNREAERMFGWKEDEVLHRPIPVIPEDRLGEFESVKRRVLGGETVRYDESVRKRKDGTLVHVAYSAAPLHDEQGKAAGVLAVVGDLSDRRKIEDTLRQSEEMYSKILSASSIGISVTGLGDGLFIDVNEAFLSIYGYTREEVIGRTSNDLHMWIHPEDRRNMVSSVREGKKRRDLEIPVRRKSGELRTVLFSAELITVEGRECLLGMTHDITDRKAAEDALRTSQERFRRYFEMGLMGMAITSPTKRFLEVNAELCRTLGYDREDILRRSWSDVTHPDDIAADVARFNRVVAHQIDGYEMEKRFIRKDGRVITCTISVSSVRRADGSIDYFVALLQDVTAKKRAEEELVNLRKAVESSGEIIFMTDRGGVFTFVNPAFTDAYGYSGEEVIGKLTPRILKGGDVDAAEYSRFWRRITGKERLRREMVNRTRAGMTVIMAMSVNPVLDEHGEITGFLAIQRDVTERRRMEAALEQAKEYAESVIQTANVMFLQLDPEGRIVKLNPAAEEITGYALSDLEGRNWFEILVPKEKFPRVWDEFERIKRAEETPEIFENPVITKSGEARQILWKNSVIRDAGSIAGTISFGMDITERKRAEVALEESASRFRQLTESIREVFWIRDTDLDKMIYVSPAYETIWQRKVGTLLASPVAWAEAVHPEDRERVMEAARTEQIEGKYDEEFRILRPSGDVRWVRARAFPVRDAASEVHRVVGVAEDITERKQAEEIRENLESQLQRSQRLESLGTLASGIAHDFNNILGIILGHTMLLGDVRSDPGRFSRSLGILKEACERGTSLVRQLLTLARKSDSVRAPLLIGDQIREVVRFLRETFPRNVLIAADVEGDLPPVLADATQIHQVLLNLCVNARDAMPGGGEIGITARFVRRAEIAALHPDMVSADYVMVRVSDTGSGMDEETRRRLFEPFFTTKGPGKGTGLGLSLVYSIVRNHDGRVDVESAPGEGARFTVYLPVPDREVAPAPASVPGVQSVRGGDETVLLVEDEEMLTELVVSVLTENGYQVIVAMDGEEGVAAFRAHRDEIDIVLTDVGLPRFGGEEVFRRIRKIDPGASVVLVSGFIEPEKKSGLQSSGAAGFIQKPYMPDELLRTVREVLDTAKRRS